jgi:ribonuclease-3
MTNAPETRQLREISRKLGYAFNNQDLLERAFRHASYVNECSLPDLTNNERLEFLGDAALDLAISHILMDLFEDATEGELSRYRASVVNERGLCRAAKELGLGEYLLLGRGEELTGGREKDSILADTMEALLGALYLDAGFEQMKRIVNRLFSSALAGIEPLKSGYDYKSLLQEYTQEIFRERPEYFLVGENGPDHDKTFVVALSFKGRKLGEGVGKSKKEAEQKAAKEAYFCLKGD